MKKKFALDYLAEKGVTIREHTASAALAADAETAGEFYDMPWAAEEAAAKRAAKEAALAASVEVVVTEPGPLGMGLASEYEDDPPEIQELVEGGQMSQHPEVRVGMVLLAVDGQAVSSHDHCMQLLVAAGRPVRLQFRAALPEADDSAAVENTELENLRSSSFSKAAAAAFNAAKSTDAPTSKLQKPSRSGISAKMAAAAAAFGGEDSAAAVGAELDAKKLRTGTSSKIAAAAAAFNTAESTDAQKSKLQKPPRSGISAKMAAAAAAFGGEESAAAVGAELDAKKKRTGTSSKIAAAAAAFNTAESTDAASGGVCYKCVKRTVVRVGIEMDSDKAQPSILNPGPGPPGWLSALSVLHSKSVLYGASIWARRAVNGGQKRWFPDRVGVEIEGLKEGTNAGGTHRVRYAAGWVSKTSGAGEVVLEEVGGKDEPESPGRGGTRGLLSSRRRSRQRSCGRKRRGRRPPRSTRHPHRTPQRCRDHRTIKAWLIWTAWGAQQI
jgi:hypothetical protein